MRIRSALLAVLAGTGLSAGALAQTEIQWWHAMGGALGEKVNAIADDFNARQSDYRVNAVYKGSYPETMTAAIAAFRARQQPHIVQVFEVGTANMMAAGGAIYPVHRLMTDSGLEWDPNAYLPAVVGYYTDPDGNMLSMPFNSSTPVMYINNGLFTDAGLDPGNPPRTWTELGEAVKRIVDSGAAPCGFTTAWQGWVQLENFSALHDIPFASNANGFEGLDTVALFNSDLHVRHIANMAEWQQSKYFDYGGRRNLAAPKFYSGECAIYMESSAGYAGIRANTDFAFTVAMLPYYDDVEGAPQNSIIGGATLWVLSGLPEADYQGVAAFFQYLSSPEVQARWHQETGYLPITLAAYELSREQGFYDENPGTDTSIKQMTLNPPTENSLGLRLGNMVQIRDVVDEELEAVWAGDKTAKQALDAAVERANALLRQFEDDNR